MNQQLTRNLVIAGLTALLPFDAVALGPQPVKLGPIEFIPTIGLAEGYDTNPEEEPAGNELSSAVTRITPSLVFRAHNRANQYEFSYLGRYEFFDNATVGSRINHHVLALAHLVGGARQRLDLTASFDQLTAPPDATNRAFNEDGNVSDTYFIGGVYGFGAQTARAQVDLGVNFTAVRYLNNLDSGSFNRDQEYDSPAAVGTLYYRIAPKTQLLAQIGVARFDYLWSGSTLDSHNLTYLAGITWKATAKTTGTLKFGYQQKQFTISDLDSIGRPSWDATMTWAASSRAQFVVSTSSFIAEGSAYTDSIPTQVYRLQWNHQWSQRFATQGSVSYTDQTYEGGSYEGRHDQTTQLGLKAIYNLRRWVDVALEYYYKQDDSNDPLATFDRNWFYLSVTFSL